MLEKWKGSRINGLEAIFVNQKQYKRNNKTIAQLKILRELAALIKTTPDLNLVLGLLLEGIHRGIGMDRVIFALYVPLKAQVRAKYVVGGDADMLLNNFSVNVGDLTSNPFSEVLFEKEAGLWVTKELLRQYSKNISQKKTVIDLNQRFFGETILSKSPIINASQAIVSIQFIFLEREISAKNWMKNYANMNNYSNEKINAVNSKRANAYFTFMNNGQIINSYATMQINRNVAIMIQLRLPMSLKEPMKFLQKSVVDSFTLIMPTDEPVEKQKAFSLNDAMKFDYPESWHIYYPNLKNNNDMSVQIHSVTKTGKVEGLIRFIAVRRNSDTKLNDQVIKLKKYFDEFLMIDIKSLVSSDTAPVYDRFLFSRYEVYKAVTRKKDDTEKEIRFALLGDREWYIFIFLLAPAEKEDLPSWSRGVHTFDLILKNLR